MTRIDRPVFIVGMPRSGSTAFHRVLAQHPGFATTTNVTRKAPTCYPALKVFFLVNRRHDPGEAGTMWDRFVGEDSDVLGAGDVTPESRAYYLKAVENVLRLYGKPRFLSKCPRNGLRMEFLREIFPDALFIHLIRDGRAVCQSIMEQRKRSGNMNVWWDVKPAGWRPWEHVEPVAAVAHQWDAVIRQMSSMAATLPPDQYVEVKYEDFSAGPRAFMERIMGFCGLAWSPAEITRVTSGIENRNDKWRKVFTPQEVDTITGIMADTLSRFGYG